MYSKVLQLRLRSGFKLRFGLDFRVRLGIMFGLVLKLGIQL